MVKKCRIVVHAFRLCFLECFLPGAQERRAGKKTEGKKENKKDKKDNQKKKRLKKEKTCSREILPPFPFKPLAGKSRHQCRWGARTLR